MTTTETPMKLTDEAKALADAQPVIDVNEAVASTSVERIAPLTPTVAEHHEIDLIPRSDELTVLAQLAVTFAQAGLVPGPLKNKPADVMLVLMTGRGLGIDPLVALRECHPIDGKVTVSPKLKLAIVRQRRLGSVWPDPDNNADHATWHATRADDPRETTYSATYSLDDAKAAGLVGKDNWKKYPRQMLQWRALGYLLDMAFGEVGTGLYSADELGAVTDDEGHAVIDVTDVQPLPGIEPKGHAEAKAATEAAAKAQEVAPEEIRALIKARIGQLPPPVIAALAGEWSAMTGQPTPDGEATPRLWPLKVLPNWQVDAANELVDEFWARAEAGEWGEWVGHTSQEATSEATAAQDGPDEAPGTDGAADQPAATGDRDEDDYCQGDPLCVELATFFTDDGLPVCDKHKPEGA